MVGWTTALIQLSFYNLVISLGCSFVFRASEAFLETKINFRPPCIKSAEYRRLRFMMHLIVPPLLINTEDKC